ncbi:MAG: hypothetical protein ACFFEL_09360 [Candidatus Thorarchaeota archaeon]
MKRVTILVVLLLLATLPPAVPVIAQSDQGFEWGFAYDDEFHFMMHLNSTGLQIDEEIYLISNDTLPSIPDSIENWTDIPYTGIEAYYTNGTHLGIEILTFVAMYNAYVPIGNWDLLSFLAYYRHNVENFTFTIVEPSFWGYRWEDDDWVLTEGEVTIYSNYTINVHVEYLKTDGFLAKYSVDAYNTTTGADAGEIVLERLDIEEYRETTDPIITNHPSDIVYVEGQVGNSITWHASDDYPATYSISRTIPGIPIAPWIIKSGLWNDTSEAITVVVDGFSVGSYYVTLVVRDLSGNHASDRVTVSVIDESAIVLQWIIIFGTGGIVLVIGAVLIRKRLTRGAVSL